MKTYLLFCHLLAFGSLLYCQPINEHASPAPNPSDGGSPVTPATESTAYFVPNKPGSSDWPSPQARSLLITSLG